MSSPGATWATDSRSITSSRSGSGGETSLANLVRLCHWHHYLKTHQNHRIVRRNGGWQWDPPDATRTEDLALNRSG